MMASVKYNISKHPGLQESFLHPLHKTSLFLSPLVEQWGMGETAGFQFTPCGLSFNILRWAGHLVPTTTYEMQQTYRPLALELLEINTQRKSLVKMHAMFL